MRRRVRKNIVQRVVMNRISLSIIGFIILIAISIPLAKNASQQYTINNEIKTLQKEIDSLQGKNEDLNSIIGYLESDDFAREQARKNLNYKNEGEEMVIINTPENENVISGDRQGNNLLKEDNNEKKISNPHKWWNYFFNS